MVGWLGTGRRVEWIDGCDAMVGSGGPEKGGAETESGREGEKQTLGSPPIGAALISASRILRAIFSGDSSASPSPSPSLSVCGPLPSSCPVCPRPCSLYPPNAHSSTLGISSGRFSTESVTPAMKYQQWRGRWGWVRREWRKEGVMMGARVGGMVGVVSGFDRVGRGVEF